MYKFKLKPHSIYINAYYQGTEEPNPKNKQYKSDKAIVVQPRFKEPFYRNYDVYDVPGVDGKTNKLGPGAGYHHMDKYKSISDFLASKRKHMKGKYKSEDKWIEDKKVRNKIKARAELLNKIIKKSIDFSIDNQINSTPILGEHGSYSDSIPFGGNMDEYLPEKDIDGKSPDALNFGRDHDDEEKVSEEIDLEDLEKKYLNPAEPSLFGLPDGIYPKSDLDAPNNENPFYGTTDSGNTLYNKISY